jgi:hypothetical protein
MQAKRNILFSALCAILCTAPTIFSGCLTSEETEFTLTLNGDGRSGTLSVIRRHMESDAQDTASQRKDFNELIANWRGDHYLLDQMEKGLYVKDRSLRSEHGVLVWRETSIFSDVAKIIPQYAPDDTLRFPLHDTKGLEIRSNGTLVAMQDSSVILWPPHTTHFELKTKTLGFSSLSGFMKRFTAMATKRPNR